MSEWIDNGLVAAKEQWDFLERLCEELDRFMDATTELIKTSSENLLKKEKRMHKLQLKAAKKRSKISEELNAAKMAAFEKSGELRKKICAIAGEATERIHEITIAYIQERRRRYFAATMTSMSEVKDSVENMHDDAVSMLFRVMGKDEDEDNNYARAAELLNSLKTKLQELQRIVEEMPGELEYEDEETVEGIKAWSHKLSSILESYAYSLHQVIDGAEKESVTYEQFRQFMEAGRECFMLYDLPEISPQKDVLELLSAFMRL